MSRARRNVTGQMANLAFSVFAALASFTVALLSALKGAYVVSTVFAVLTVGFVLRART